MYSAKVRIFNNILNLGYIHLTRPSVFIRNKPILSSQRVLHKDFDRNDLAEGYLSS
jgi:hypothetical protein